MIIALIFKNRLGFDSKILKLDHNMKNGHCRSRINQDIIMLLKTVTLVLKIGENQSKIGY